MIEPLYITSRTDWTPELIEQMYREIEKIALEEMELDVYPNSIEIITAEQMLDAYASIGLPIHYNHWSFGKDFLKSSRAYSKGRAGLAYEIVVNTDPCISYLMEENDMLMQTMVMAHAAFGHNAVFKNNECFKQWTNAGSIIDYMIFARDYIRQCEERYGEEEVEMVLDAAHSLAPHGIDKFKRKHHPKLSEEARLKKLLDDEENRRQELDIIMKRTSFKDVDLSDHDEDDYIEEEENLLYFIMKYSPNLPQWKREIVRIVYKVNQYFYPQSQCVTGEQLVSTGSGLFRLDELITEEGYLPKTGVQLLTQGDKLTPISHTYLKRQAKVIRVTTQTGRVYTGTPEHPLMALHGTQHKMHKLGDLQLGDHLVLQTRYENAFSKEEVALKPVELTNTVQCELCDFTTNYLPTHVQTHGIPTVNLPSRYPATLNPLMGELLGYLKTMTLGEGSHVFNFNDTPTDRFTYILKELFGIEPGCESFSSWGLRTFVDQNFTFEDGVPLCIRQSPAPVVKAYLRTIFDRRTNGRDAVSNFLYRTYSKDEAQQLQVLLNCLGIITTVKAEHWTTFGLCEAMGIEHAGDRSEATVFCLRIVPSYKAIFEEVIGTNLPLPFFEGNPRIASIDLIPGGKALLDSIRTYVIDARAKHHDSTRGMFYADKKRAGMLIHQQSIPRLEDLPVVRADELSFEDVRRDLKKYEVACSQGCPAAVQLRKLLEISSGCFYDRVISVEELDELHDVYDVTVPENHLFWMSGLISHNTKNLNEGFATFTHYYIMTRLEEKGFLSPDAFMSFLEHHSAVIYQPEYNKRRYSGINPYALGFAIFQDIKRICENPTDEDREWFPQLIGKRWQDAVKEAAFEHRDDGFVAQYLSPKVIRDFRMFAVSLKHPDDDDTPEIPAIVSEIHDDVGYKNLRNSLARSMERINHVPQIAVVSADLEGSRTLVLQYIPYMGRSLDLDDADVVVEHIDYLWGYAAELSC